MDKLKFYEVDEDYIDYLRNFDERVAMPKKGDRTQSRKYVGILFKINDFNYFVPLSSYKEHLHDQFGERHDFIKITEKNPKNKYQKYAVLYLNNMIPVPDNALISFDITTDVSDPQYSNLLKREYLVCVDKTKQIRESSRIVYNTRKELPDGKLGKRCCDFLLLEEKCLAYKNEPQIVDNEKAI